MVQSKIKQLPEALANQIAAGEVVERPASVVKELVENAIDAGADTIDIDIVEAGIQSIQVTDNGTGMTAEDLPQAFLAHATSKIYRLTDLFAIQSLGFRGEALASIASVAKVYVESMPHEAETGAFIQLEGSKIINQGQAKARPGTLIKVDSLFYNTPARLKHLKSITTELRHILQYVQQVAMAYPAIRLNLTSDGKRIFYTVGSGDLRQAIAHVYQPSVARQLLEIQAEDDDFKIKGFISPPTFTRTNRNYIHWFINQRPVRNIMLDKVLLKAYGKQLMIGRYPVAVIHIDLDPRLVDVNVHPTKQTVRLSKEDELATLIESAVVQMLSEINPIPQANRETLAESGVHRKAYREPKAEPIPLQFHRPSSDEKKAPDERQEEALRGHKASNHLDESLSAYQSSEEGINQAGNQLTNKLRDNQTKNQAENRISDQPEENQLEEPFSDQTEERHPQPAGIPFAELRYVGQIHGTYLIAESETSFYLIDQHAAQERIRYEAFMSRDYDVSQQQTLLMPLVLQFSPAETEQVTNHLEDLDRIGLHLSAFGPTSFQLETYPSWIYADQLEKTVYDTIELVIEQPNLRVNDLLEEALIMQSCRGAIKANHRLSQTEATQLIRDMDGLKDPYHCPHGRPVFIEFTDYNLERLFKRIQDPHEGALR